MPLLPIGAQVLLKFNALLYSPTHKNYKSCFQPFGLFGDWFFHFLHPLTCYWNFVGQKIFKHPCPILLYQFDFLFHYFSPSMIFHNYLKLLGLWNNSKAPTQSFSLILRYVLLHCLMEMIAMKKVLNMCVVDQGTLQLQVHP